MNVDNSMTQKMEHSRMMLAEIHELRGYKKGLEDASEADKKFLETYIPMYKTNQNANEGNNA